jgi:anaerobic selenocysteine-containing dehydrogenase
MMHPKDAAMLGIDNKELVEVYNKIGSLQLPVEITEDIMQSVVSIPHGYGHGRKGVKLTEAQKAPGVSINDLTDPSILDNLSGNAVLNNIPVEIRKIQSTEV